MSRAILVFALAAIVLAAPVVAQAVPPSIVNARVELAAGTAPAQGLSLIGKGRDVEWLGWQIVALGEAADVCCWRDNFERRGCSLAEQENGWGTQDPEDRAAEVGLIVLVGIRDGEPVRLRLASEGCPVEGAGRRLLWLGAVGAEASLAALEALVSVDRKALSGPALGAIAYHADPRPDAILERRAKDKALGRDERQQALFWAGNARGEKGYAMLERVLDSEPDPQLREHAVFALTQSPVPGAHARIREVSAEDRSAQVRGQALFWLAQTNAPGAGEWILSRLDNDPDSQVREQAVFALTQLENGTEHLLALLRSKRDPEIVRKALFWLGQSSDPRAFDELERILDR
jgi:hypothetical protein